MRREIGYVSFVGLALIIIMLSWVTSPTADSGPFEGTNLLAIVGQVRGGAAGNAGDSNDTTYCFASDNAATQLVRTDGTAIGQSQVASLYGSPDGMTIYDDGVDVNSPSYSGFGGPKTVVGADLSDAAGWPGIVVASGSVAIDPLLGRFKFHEGGTAQVVGSWDPGTSAHDGVFVQGNYAYVTDWSRGLDILDISNPSNPIWKGNAPAISGGMGNGMDVVVDGDFAYVAMSVGGLRIYDITDPASPTKVGSAKAPENEKALHLCKVGNLVYVADETNGVIIYNVATPTNPTEVGRCPVGFAESVWVAGDYAYVTTGLNGLYIYDVSTPATPVYKGSLATLGYSYDVQVMGNYAYVVEGSQGLRVVDVSSPTNPTHVTVAATTGQAYDVRIANGFAYVAERGDPGSLQIFDLSNPTAPVSSSQYTVSGTGANGIMGVCPTGSLVCAASNALGLLIINPNASEAPYGAVTVDYNWNDTSATATPTLTPTPTATPDPSATASLTLQVALQGRGTSPSPSWEVSLHVELTAPQGGAVQHTFDVICNTAGQATLDGIPQGSYDVCVGGSTSLVNVFRSQNLQAGAHSLDMGTLLEGDATQDGRISATDLAILATAYGTQTGEAGYDTRADFNSDGRISVSDLALLATNYGQEGPIEVTGS